VLKIELLFVPFLAVVLIEGDEIGIEVVVL